MIRIPQKTSLSAAILMLAMLFLNAVPAGAQNEGDGGQKPVSKHIFRFIYIAPDRAVDGKTMLNELKIPLDKATTDGDPTIFYLAHGSSPKIVKFNMGEDIKESQEEYKRNIEYNVGNVKTVSWQLEAASDRQNILNLLRTYNFIDEDGQFVYGDAVIDFHVGKEVWSKGANESLIGALFFDLDIAKYLGPKMKMHVYAYWPPADGSPYKDGKPFGELNFDDINKLISPIRKQNQ